MKNNNDISSPLRISMALLVISACVALLLAAVNAATEDKIEANKTAAINEAILAIFPESDGSETEESAFESPVNAVYAVKNGGGCVGWCVSVSPKGFGGEIEMMVGVTPSGECVGVRIVTISETPGLGSRVNDAGYLAGYTGKSGTLNLGRDVDAVAGATVSSKAVLAGVNAALALDGLYENASGGALE